MQILASNPEGGDAAYRRTAPMRRHSRLIVGPLSYVLKCRQQPLLSCVGAEGEKVQALGRAAAASKAGHRPHELEGRARAAHGAPTEPVGGSAAKPPSRQSAGLTQAGGVYFPRYRSSAARSYSR